MATIPVSHVTEQPGGIRFPWVIRCQRCGAEVARVSQEELTAMVMVDTVEPVLCFDCEITLKVYQPSIGARLYPQEQVAPWPTISVPRSLLGLV
jgi:hypothetical protein